VSLDDPNKATDSKFIARLQAAKRNAEEFGRHQRAEAGLEVGDGNRHHALLEAAQDITLNSDKKTAADNKDSMVWFDIIQQHIEDLQTLVVGAEADFTNAYGEDWREQFAMRILEPDVMPQRRNGESMKDYRERVEQALMDELLNDDGTIKDEYKDHLEYGKLAQWAQWKYDQQQANALTDPSMSEKDRAERYETFTRSPTFQRLNQQTQSSELNEQISEMKDEIKDDMLSATPSKTEGNFLG
jgi:hypothetical protein